LGHPVHNYDDTRIMVRDTVDCDQSNVYSSRVVFFLVYSSKASLLLISFHTVGRLIAIPYEINPQSPVESNLFWHDGNAGGICVDRIRVIFLRKQS